MLGEPVSLRIPEVVGVRLVGRLRPEVTATDLVLTLTERLRAHGVVQKFVEYCGPGLDHLTVPERAMFTFEHMRPDLRHVSINFHVELLPQMATATMQTIWPVKDAMSAADRTGKPGIINTCHAWADYSPVVKRYYPEFHIPAAEKTER